MGAPMLLPPSLRERFQLVRPLGQGATGMVVLVRDQELDREAAIKLYTPPRGAPRSLRLRFRQEAEVAAGLKHPNMVPVYDFGAEEGEDAWILYEYVPGCDLRIRIRSPEPIPEGTVLEWGEQLADALQCMHEAGLVHRDVKPANVILREDGWIFLADLGLVRAEKDSRFQTTTGVLVGTPHYMAPELWLQRKASPAVDQFSLAVTLHECLCERSVYTHGSLEEIMAWCHGESELQVRPELRSRRPDIAEVLERALRRHPEDRWPDAAAFGAALRSVRDRGSGSGPRAAVPETVTAPRSVLRPRSAARRRALTPLVLVLGLAFLGGWLLTGEAPPPRPPPATAPAENEELVRAERALRRAVETLRRTSGDLYRSGVAAPYKEAHLHLDWYTSAITRAAVDAAVGRLDDWLRRDREAAATRPGRAAARRALIRDVFRKHDGLGAIVWDIVRLGRHVNRIAGLILGDRLELTKSQMTQVLANYEGIRTNIWETLDRLRSRVGEAPTDAELLVLGSLGSMTLWQPSRHLFPAFGDAAERGYGDFPELLPRAEDHVTRNGAFDSLIDCRTRRAHLDRLSRLEDPALGVGLRGALTTLSILARPGACGRSAAEEDLERLAAFAARARREAGTSPACSDRRSLDHMVGRLEGIAAVETRGAVAILREVCPP